jgi:hypothetical protein
MNGGKTFRTQPQPLLDIKLPQEYIDTAEALLQTMGNAKYATLSQPQVAYEVKLDHMYIKAHYFDAVDKNYFYPGDTVHIEDADLLIDKNIRVISFTRNLLAPYYYEIKLDDVARKPKSWINRNKISNMGNAVNKYVTSPTFIKRVVNTVLTVENTNIYGSNDIRCGINIEIQHGSNFINFSDPNDWDTLDYKLDVDIRKVDTTLYYDAISKQSDGFFIILEAGVGDFSDQPILLDYKATKVR